MCSRIQSSAASRSLSFMGDLIGLIGPRNHPLEIERRQLLCKCAGEVGKTARILATASSPSFDSAAMPACWTNGFALMRKLD